MISLIITIIVLLILITVSLSVLVGDNGILRKGQKSSVETSKAEVKQDIELKISETQIGNYGILTKDDILEAINDLDGLDAERDGEVIEGEYKDYPFEIDEDNKVIVGDILNGAKPEGTIEILTLGEDLEEVEIRVTGSITEGEITSIVAINGAELKTSESNTSKVFKVIDNGKFRFRIRGSNGRSARVECSITNIVPTKVDIITAISEIENSGNKKIRVIGSQNTEIYSFNVIYHKGDMILDGSTNFEGATLANNVYEFGDSEKDPANRDRDAQNTVVLKVEGNLTINNGVTLTSVKNKNDYGGPKGLLIFCTGTLTNNGNISMSKRGAKAIGQNVYLLRNEDGSFEFVPSTGGERRDYC